MTSPLNEALRKTRQTWVSVGLLQDEIARLDRRCQQEQLSRKAAVKQAVREWLTREESHATQG